MGVFVSATATDASGNTSEFGAMVTANAPVNTVPSSVTTSEDTTFLFNGANTISVADPDELLLLTVQLTVSNGTLSLGVLPGTPSLTLTGLAPILNASLAALRYTPNADYNGWDTLTVTTTDSGGLQDTDWVGISINPVDDVDPLAGNDAVTTAENTSVSGSVAGNDSVGVDTPATWTVLSGPANGTSGDEHRHRGVHLHPERRLLRL